MPAATDWHQPGNIELKTKMEGVTFLADVHLGKLARLLRMIGFDTAYSNAYSHEELIRIAMEQGRVLLSKNGALQKRHPALQLLVIVHDDPEKQLQQVLQRYPLPTYLHAFTRCLVCNGTLHVIAKADIQHLLPENTRNYYDEFRQCQDCHRLYWNGPHYHRMLGLLARIREQKDKEKSNDSEAV